jgi:TonB family protein
MLGSLVFVLFLLLNPSAARGQNKKNNCDHPPKVLSQPSFSDEDKVKWKGKAVSGKVALVISENGDVDDAKILSASPREAGESLLGAVKRAKFAPRLGCGELKTEVFFTLNR